jgi:hypothetical protein
LQVGQICCAVDKTKLKNKTAPAPERIGTKLRIGAFGVAWMVPPAFRPSLPVPSIGPSAIGHRMNP